MKTDADSSQKDVSQVSRKINLCFAYESCRRNPSFTAPSTGQTCLLSPRVICLGCHFPPALTFRLQILASCPGASLNPHIDKIFFFSFVRLLVQQNEAFFFFSFLDKECQANEMVGINCVSPSSTRQLYCWQSKQCVCVSLRGIVSLLECSL